ncbi:MAG: hypothetical protein AAFV45_06395 [Pseudomonadota bacterium]
MSRHDTPRLEHGDSMAKAQVQGMIPSSDDNSTMRRVFRCLARDSAILFQNSTDSGSEGFFRLGISSRGQLTEI